ncbi:MAG: hypothetical protein IPJ61_21470 [Tessaracoccus sp.]|uniref:hypothetical protein n=1 Tax=Tessaracoccus sp. TaxID=1971211 RepID=UPI001EB9122F|nr:hypothetical protein [Tessaracoccus sp.]MBK7823559.1 hypothetical protein [Tessaracoccus sp.]
MLVPLEGIGDYVDITAVVNGWQALVIIVLVFAVLIWPGIISMLNRRSMKDIKKTLTENNGGSSVKDALDSIKAVQATQGKKLEDHINWSEGYVKDVGVRLEKLEAKPVKHGLFGH